MCTFGSADCAGSGNLILGMTVGCNARLALPLVGVGGAKVVTPDAVGGGDANRAS